MNTETHYETLDPEDWDKMCELYWLENKNRYYPF